jgi:hypothetical protein
VEPSAHQFGSFEDHLGDHAAGVVADVLVTFSVGRHDRPVAFKLPCPFTRSLRYAAATAFGGAIAGYEGRGLI